MGAQTLGETSARLGSLPWGSAPAADRAVRGWRDRPSADPPRRLAPAAARLRPVTTPPGHRAFVAVAVAASDRARDNAPQAMAPRAVQPTAGPPPRGGGYSHGGYVPVCPASLPGHRLVEMPVAAQR